MSNMSDRDVIAWARRSADIWEQKHGAAAGIVAQYRRLADLAEKGAEDWQPIASAPRDTRIILGAEGHIFTGEVTSGIGPVDDDGRRQNATHWRPLPAPPGGER